MSPRRSHLRLRTRAHSRTHSHSPGTAATRPPRLGVGGREAGGWVAEGGAGRGRGARGSGRFHGEPPAGGRGRRVAGGTRVAGGGGGDGNLFGWLRGTTRGFTSSQSNFVAVVQDCRAAARGGPGVGAGCGVLGSGGTAAGPPERGARRGRRAGRAAGGSGAPPGAEGKCGRGPGGLRDAGPRVPPA